MLSIQEMVNKTKEQRRQIQRVLDAKGYYHPEDANLLMGQKRSIQRELSESLRKIPLREFLGKGVAGANNLVPDKLHTILIYSSKKFDLVPLISMQVVEGWQGGDLKVSIVRDHSMKAHGYASGGEISLGVGETTQATITPEAFGQDLRITNEQIEDSLWDLVEWHVSQAAKSMGYIATERAIPVLTTASDGDGTVNTGTTATMDTTVWTEIMTGVDAVGQDEFIANTLLITPEAWHHTVEQTQYNIVATATKPPAEGFDLKLQMLDTLFSASPSLHDPADSLPGAFTACKTVIFDRNNALLTGRKRWLQIENYSDPVNDLAGAVVTGRQDSVTIYNDSIYVLTEAAT